MKQATEKVEEWTTTEVSNPNSLPPQVTEETDLFGSNAYPVSPPPVTIDDIPSFETEQGTELADAGLVSY